MRKTLSAALLLLCAGVLSLTGCIEYPADASANPVTVPGEPQAVSKDSSGRLLNELLSAAAEQLGVTIKGLVEVLKSAPDFEDAAEKLKITAETLREVVPVERLREALRILTADEPDSVILPIGGR